jgi:hypothetical protein
MNLCFLHFPKTGGTFIKGICKENNIYTINHNPISLLYKTENQKKSWHPRNKYHVFSVIRNPYDWHISRYFYYCQLSSKLNKNTIVNKLDWNISYFNTFNLSISQFQQQFPTFESYIIYGLNCKDERSTRFWMSDIYKYQCYYNDGFDIDTVLRFENLNNELLKLLENFDYKYNVNIYNGDKNSSNHNIYQNYYNKNLIDIITKKEELILNTYGYKYEIL